MRILISAGELSGSMHIAFWINKWRQIDPKVQFYGMGGPAMERAGVKLLINSERELSVIGLGGLFSKIGRLLKAWRIMLKTLTHDKPDWLILVDYAGFNLPLAKRAKQLGIKVCYYIPPKIWAWRAGRLKQLKRYIDLLAVILPFEVSYYAKRGVQAHYVGNPSWQAIHELQTNAILVAAQSFTPSSVTPIKTVGLLPGSRQQEICSLLPVMLEAARILQQQLPRMVRFCLLPAKSVVMQPLQAILANYPDVPVEILASGDWIALQKCQAAIVASGTATLEVALLKIPMVAVYKLAWWEYWLARYFITIPYVTLCNIVAGFAAIKELLQYDCRANNLAQEVRKLLLDSAYIAKQQISYQQIQDALNISTQDDLIALLH